MIASHNPGKLAEFDLLLAGFGLTLLGAAALGLSEPEETADSFIGNATLKARVASAASGLPALADDSGFCVRALGGAPGIHSARWAGPGRDFTHAMRRVHEAVQRSATPLDDAAWFVSVLCLAWPDGACTCFEGRVSGVLRWPPAGGNGHGYDPVFQPDGEALRFAEMTDQRKNAISHRARAFERLTASCLAEPACPTPR